MNLFILDKSPVKAAQFYCNRHVVKICSEAANLLMWPFKLAGWRLPNNKQGKEITLSHLNHPVSRWVRANHVNYNWALTHFIELLNQYSERYGRFHFARVYADFILANLNEITDTLPVGTAVPFARCFGKYKDWLDTTCKDTVEAYRLYYITDKRSFALWPSGKQVPNWFANKSEMAAGIFIDPSFKNGKYTKRK